MQRTLPAVDPDPSGSDFGALSAGGPKYLADAVERRRELARTYLTDWNGWVNTSDMWDDFLQFFDTEAKMSQYANLWRVFCCGQLDKLLGEYKDSNVPHMLRLTDSGVDAATLRDSGNFDAMNQYLDGNFNYVGVAYRRPMTETSPGMFKNRLAMATGAGTTGPLAFAQVSIFIPAPRYRCCPWAWPINAPGDPGVPGWSPTLPPWDWTAPVAPPPGAVVGWVDNRDNWPSEWTLFNQNWTAQLAPATTNSLAGILQQPMTQQLVPNYQPPNLGNSTPQDLRRINTH
jgi:hypothetical protein